MHLLLLLVLLICVTTPVSAQNETVAQVERASEDARLLDQMNRVSQSLTMYCMINHRFPEAGDEMNDEKNQLNQLVPNPPYSPHSMRLAQGLDANPLFAQQEMPDVPGVENSDTGSTLDRIRLVFDPSLSELEVQEWRTDPPVDWREPPGTITAISNNQSLFIVWGAGADGLPLRDQFSKQVMFLIGRYHMLYDTAD